MNSRTIKYFKLLSVAAAGCAFLTSSALGAPAVLDTAVNPANGHTYYLLANSNWTNAENAAVGLGGHLVTINNLAENNWVWDRWGTNRTLWTGLYNPISGGGGGAQHASNFVWVSGDSSTYRNWNPGEPNSDYHAYIYSKNLGAIGGKWNDGNGSSTQNPGEFPFYGVVEVAICTPHRATATATVVNGFVVGATLNDSGCGYTNTPSVLIEGGGGSGATATATMMDGRVAQINITSAGCCYTNAPKITIAPPPMVPILKIIVSKVKVIQSSLVIGWKYVLESSDDFNSWQPTGPEFTAQSESVTNEFDVDLTGEFFRMRVVP